MLIKQAMQTNKGKKSETVTQANSSTNSAKTPDQRATLSRIELQKENIFITPS